jgi:hypothetical protein
MGDLTLTEIWAWLLGAALAIRTLSDAAEKIVKAIKVAKAPNDEQNRRLDELEEWRKGVDQKLINDNNHLSTIDSDNRVTQRALIALLEHGIDGNNIKQMQDAKNELQNHLINR